MTTPNPDALIVTQGVRDAAADIARFYCGNDSEMPDALRDGRLERHFTLDVCARLADPNREIERRGSDEVPTLQQAIRWLQKFGDADEVASTTPRKIANELAAMHTLLVRLAALAEPRSDWRVPERTHLMWCVMKVFRQAPDDDKRTMYELMTDALLLALKTPESTAEASDNKENTRAE